MAKNVFTVKACKTAFYYEWQQGFSVFLVKDQCFAPLAITQERLDYMQERLEEEDIDWDNLTQDEKKDLYVLCLAKDGNIPVSYADYRKHSHMDPVYVEDLVLFNATDGYLDMNDDLYISGKHVINMSRIMKLVDPDHKYSQEEMIDIYNSIYPFIKRDEEGKNQE